MRRRVLIVLPVAALVVAAAAWGVWRYAGLGGSTPVEGWVREYLVAVLQRHLNPQVHIGDLDYEYPRTVNISELRLTESDVDILAVNHVRLELAEIPRTGEPILIERIELAAPTVRLEPASGGGIVGWSNLVRGKSGPAQTANTAETAKPAETAVEPGYRVSDFMRLRHARIRNGSFARRSVNGRHETILTNINAELETPEAKEGPGWYQLIGALTRDELFKISLDGRFNVDDGETVVNALHIAGTLDETRYSVFPESVQVFLRQHQLQGSLALDASGAWSPSDKSRAKVSVKAQLEDTRFVHGGAVMSSKRVDFQGDLSGGEIRAEAAGDVLDGNATIRFRTATEDATPGELTINLAHVDVTQLIELAPQGIHRTLDSLRPQGRVSGQVNAKLGSDFKLVSADSDATLEPLALELLQKAIKSPKVTLLAAVEGGETRLEFVAAELNSEANAARDVRVKIDLTSNGVDLSASLAAFGGRADGSIQFGSKLAGRYPFSIRTSGIRLEEFQSFAGGGAIRQSMRGAVSGNLEGTWDGNEWAASTWGGNLSIADGRLLLDSVSFPISCDKLNVKLNDRRLELDGRLNSAGGSFTGRIGWDVPGVTTVDAAGRAETVSLAALLDATGQTWNRTPNGGTQLDGRFTGDFSLTLPTQQKDGTTGRFDFRAGACHCMVGTTRVPIDACEINAELRDKRLAGQLHLTLLGGRAEIKGNLSLGSQNEWGAGWLIRGVHLEKLATLKPGAKRHHYRGRLSGDGDIKGRLSAWPDSLSGRGKLEVTQGHLVELPVIFEIVKLLKPAALLIGSASEDKAHASFAIHPNGVECDAFDVESPLMAIRGRGRVQFDGGLDLVVRATAAPKITKLLGPLDRLIDDASGRLVTYRVGGTVDQPVIRVEPLGIPMFPGE